MPRDGSGIYTTPAGTTAVPDTTIESAKYNGNVADVAADLNAARPIVAGGTGGNSAATARANLKAEVAGANVTNYDTHAFENGSFYSVAGATGAPNGNTTSWFFGTCVMVDSGLISVSAQDHVTGIVYNRIKVGGAGAPWGAWTAAGSGAFVELAGDIMSGDLEINKTSPLLYLKKTASGQNAGIYGYQGANARWFVAVGDGAVEGGSNTGSNFALYRYNDAGGFIGGAFSIDRATGVVSAGPGHYPAAAKDLVSKDYADTKVAKTGDTMNGTLLMQDAAITLNKADGGNYNIIQGQTAGQMRWRMDIGSGGGETGGNAGSAFTLHAFGDGGGYLGTAIDINRATRQAYFSGAVKADGGFETNTAITMTAFYPRIYMRGDAGGNSSIEFGTGPIWNITSDTNNWVVQANGQPGGLNINRFSGDILTAGKMQCNSGYVCRQGVGGTTGSVFNFFWASPNLQAWIDLTNIGNITYTSDYRIKKDVADLPSTWDAVKALRPVSYTDAAYTPKVEVERMLKEAADARERGDPKAAKPGEEIITPMFVDGTEPRWGFIAHEVQAALLPTAAQGVKDDPLAVQSLNLGPIVASLTKALQEAMARIEALEAAAAVPVR